MTPPPPTFQNAAATLEASTQRDLGTSHDPCNQPRNQPRVTRCTQQPAATTHGVNGGDEHGSDEHGVNDGDTNGEDDPEPRPRLILHFNVSKYVLMVIVMEEQFILRVPPNVAERIERLLNENNASSSEDKSLDLSFREDGRSGTFMIGNEQFPASLLDLPCVVESYKTYDDNSLIKTADIGQMIMVRESGDAAPDVIDCPPDSGNKLNFGYFLDRNSHVETAEQEEGDENARGANKKSAPKPAPKHDIPENLTNAGEADRSDSEESDDSV
ncbi:hypothetical protein JHK87_016913 [Glycine soja]|nr:hypothetical protein JHK87_016913 [Glycine soja]